MLIEFSVANFRSFKDKAVISFVASNLKSQDKDKGVDENNAFSAIDDIRLLKSAVVYGANGSGKSNLIKAILFMKSLVDKSASSANSIEKISIDSYKFDSYSENEPSLFEIICIVENVIYRYGFEIKDGFVDKEWLYHIPNKRESLLFERIGTNFKYTKVFSKEPSISRLTRRNALFLSTSAQWNNSTAMLLVAWFSRIVNFSLHELPKNIITPALMNAKSVSEVVQKIVKTFDLGFERLDFVEDDGILRKTIGDSLTKEMEDRYGKDFFNSKLLSVHKMYNKEHKMIDLIPVDFDDYQSEGTKKLVLLVSMIVIYSKVQAVLLIDEFDSKLHPKILLDLIKIINHQSISDKLQSLVCVHNTVLLKSSIFRRDQIWFTEKNQYGESCLYSLAEFKVRNDASFDKDYLEGRYGAIPFVDSQNFVGEFSK